MTEQFEKKQFILRPGCKGLEDVFSDLLGFLMAWKDRLSLEVVVRQYKKDRSDLQNNYLHGWIFRRQIMAKLNESGRMIILEDGTEKEWNVDDLKAFFKMPFIIDQVHDRKFFFAAGQEIQEEIHPSKWSTEKFSKYCDLVCQYAYDVFEIDVEPPISGYWLSIMREMES